MGRIRPVFFLIFFQVRVLQQKIVAFQPSVTLLLQGEQDAFCPASRGVNPC